MRPYLMEVEVVDRDGIESDTCRLLFDDAFGQLALPKVRSPVQVLLNGVEVFDGVVDSTPWRLSRGGGRVLEVNCKAFDTRGKATEPQLWNGDDMSLKDALAKAGQLAGYTVTVDPGFAEIMRDYWSPSGMSFVEWGEKLRREFGATFKVRGKQAVFAGRNGGQSPRGGALPVVMASCRPGGNVISADIDPSKGRPRSKTKRVRYFDRKAAQFKELDVEIELPDLGDAIDTQRWLAVDEGQASDQAKGHKSDTEQDAGIGSLEMTIAPEAMAEGALVLSGARPGIDGRYRISGAVHKANRSGGATTRCELAQPQNGAGSDNRKVTSVIARP
ncbi:phage late control D family protein [Aurantimonas coralicida]|uniref:phage late control D family protein n=1 Tax=Aurantimonas coralicida TaxID=182270 RepID=UPI001E3D10A0|nr:late control D family protein [Aurantimonas coralicida]MCD1644341.1 late control D family protein [Aurantimonas coralicida]